MGRHEKSDLSLTFGEQERPNDAAHPDAREAPCQFKRPVARAGGRGRWTSY